MVPEPFQETAVVPEALERFRKVNEIEILVP